MRLLAVDFGEKRIGLAASDEAGAVVVPVGTVSRRSDAQAAAEVAAAARERGVKRIVVGYPRRAGGVASLLARRARTLLEMVSDLNLALDVNTAGLRKGSGLFPDLHLLERACQLRIPIAVGSYAHKLEDIGRNN